MGREIRDQRINEKNLESENLMKKTAFILTLAAFLTGCTTTGVSNPATPSIIKTKKTAKISRAGCKIVGRLNRKSSDKNLVDGLCKLSRKFGTVHVNGNHRHGNCRTVKENPSVKGSLHLYIKGCKAADIWIKGVKGRTILNWWGANIGGGRGSYRCRRFVHVDVGANRTWHWRTSCRRR